MNEEEIRIIERRSRAAFDASVEATDAATRSRLAGARRAALAGLDRGRPGRATTWIPVGAAAAAVVAALLWQQESTEAPAPAQAAIAHEDLDIVTAGEDFDLFGEDPEFVAWAAGEIADDVG